MPHEILEDCGRGSLDVGIPPVDPRMVGPEGGTEQPVAGLGHGLAPAGLGGKAVPVLDVLLHLLAKVLLDERDVAVGDAVVGIVLQGLEVLL